MKKYELTCLLSPELLDEEAKSIQEKIHSFIQEEGGILGDTGNPTKKILSYPVKKNRQAFLSNVEFQLSPDKIKELEKKLKDEEKIIRYLVMAKVIKERQKGAASRQRAIAPTSRKRTPKVELKEIEKKLEEILKEK